MRETDFNHDYDTLLITITIEARVGSYENIYITTIRFVIEGPLKRIPRRSRAAVAQSFIGTEDHGCAVVPRQSLPCP